MSASRQSKEQSETQKQDQGQEGSVSDQRASLNLELGAFAFAFERLNKILTLKTLLRTDVETEIASLEEELAEFDEYAGQPEGSRLRLLMVEEYPQAIYLRYKIGISKGYIHAELSDEMMGDLKDRVKELKDKADAKMEQIRKLITPVSRVGWVESMFGPAGSKHHIAITLEE